MNIPFNKLCLEGGEIDNVLDTIRSGKIGGDGKYNQLCQEEIAQTLGTKQVFLTTSGSSALELAAIMYNIGPGDEVIVPSFTFVSTVNAFCIRGAKPVFVDIRPDTFNMDETLIEKKITGNTKAIVPVHYGGVACEMDPINALARQYGLRVIEDAALAFLSTYRGRQAGTLGDVGCYSFHETKAIVAGEGGAIAVNRVEDVERVEILREKGTNRAAFLRGDVEKYVWVNVGSSFLPSEMIGAFLYGQWRARERILSKRKAIFDNYTRLFQPLIDNGTVRGPVIPGPCAINYCQYHLLVKNEETRNRLLAFLRGHRVQAVFHYVPLHGSPYAQKKKWGKRLPVTDDVAARILRLPFYNSLTPEEQETVAGLVYRFFGESKKP